MGASPTEPRFGEADLTNCERELIHLSGSIQPHGVLLVLAEPRLTVVQVSENVESLLGFAPDVLLGSPVEALGFAAANAVRALAAEPMLLAPQPMRLVLETPSGPLSCNGLMHRPPTGGLLLELEEIVPVADRRPMPALAQRLTQTVTRLSAAHSIPALADLVVHDMRELIGYDRAMVYRFDADGHGEIIAERKRDGLESFLHRHYPATDIPQRARELYLRNKVRLLVDAGYVPVPLVPRVSPITGEDLDLSMSVLRSISPMHTQYLQNMGVTGTVVASLIHEGKLWGLISCHHYTAKYLPYDMRAAVELVAEVVSTRISRWSTSRRRRPKSSCGGSNIGSSKPRPRTATGGARSSTRRVSCCNRLELPARRCSSMAKSRSPAKCPPRPTSVRCSRSSTRRTCSQCSPARASRSSHRT